MRTPDFRFISLALFLTAGRTLAQPTPPPIALSPTPDSMILRFSERSETNSWTIETSENLNEWSPLADVLELNGPGRFDDLEHHRRRYYRVLHHGSDIQAALDRNRRKWQHAGVTDYDFTFQWICFCTPDYVQPVVIAVRDGEITSVRVALDGTELDPSQFSRYRTIDGLLDLLQEALDNHAHRISAIFAPRYGYPRRAFIDHIEFAVDDELSFTVTDFHPLPLLPTVQITDDPPSAISQDPFTLPGKEPVRIDGNTITLTVQYGGGCAEHDFDLFMSPGAFLESFPVQANLYLRHNAHGDLCKALITRNISFDLTPIADLYRTQYGHSDPIILNVFHYSDTDPTEKTSVTYNP